MKLSLFAFFTLLMLPVLTCSAPLADAGEVLPEVFLDYATGEIMERYEGFEIRHFPSVKPEEASQWQHEVIDAVDAYPPALREKFFERRQWMLNKVAAALKRGRFAWGTVKYLKQDIPRRVRNFKNRDQYQIITIFGSHPEQAPTLGLTELGNDFSETILNAVNHLLWRSHDLIVNANEAGVQLGVAIGFGAGFNKGNPNSKLGRMVENVSEFLSKYISYHVGSFNLFVGVNFQDKKIFVEATAEKERISDVITMVLEAYVGPRFGVFVDHMTGDRIMQTREGEVFYAGIGTISRAPGFASFGGAWAFGLPPSPFSAGYIFRTRWHRKPLMRIQLAPDRPPFFELARAKKCRDLLSDR